MASTRQMNRIGGSLLKKAEHLASEIVGRMSAKTAGAQSSRAFITNASVGDMYEIKAAKLALDHAQSPRVREIAETMVADHTTSTHQLRSALRTNEAKGEGAMPDKVDRRRKRMLDHLREARDGDFDRAYLDQQVAAHKETLDLMNGYAARGPNPQLRSFAAGTAPVVKRHLQRMGALREELAL